MLELNDMRLSSKSSEEEEEEEASRSIGVAEDIHSRVSMKRSSSSPRPSQFNVTNFQGCIVAVGGGGGSRAGGGDGFCEEACFSEIVNILTIQKGTKLHLKKFRWSGVYLSPPNEHRSTAGSKLPHLCYSFQRNSVIQTLQFLI
ncbi:hypothetical protein K1719_022357 [Acacia pycnantha]|nr:hypothetical protein K1719_022357 [Acacia pycnantha]